MLEEVNLFLEKYPDARIQIDRSGRLAVDYRVSTPSKDNNSFVDHYLRLRILLNSDGEPEKMFIDCYNGQNNIEEEYNIISYLKTETCLE